MSTGQQDGDVETPPDLEKGERVKKEERLKIDEAASGKRFWISIVLCLLGIGAVASGAVWGPAELIWVGGIAAIVFGIVSVGVLFFNMNTPQGGASGQLPKNYTKTTTWSKEGFQTKPEAEAEAEAEAAKERGGEKP